MTTPQEHGCTAACGACRAPGHQREPCMATPQESGCTWGVTSCQGSHPACQHARLAPPEHQREACMTTAQEFGCMWGVPSCQGSHPQCQDAGLAPPEHQRQACMTRPQEYGCMWGVPSCQGSDQSSSVVHRRVISRCTQEHGKICALSIEGDVFFPANARGASRVPSRTPGEVAAPRATCDRVLSPGMRRPVCSRTPGAWSCTLGLVFGAALVAGSSSFTGCTHGGGGTLAVLFGNADWSSLSTMCGCNVGSQVQVGSASGNGDDLRAPTWGCFPPVLCGMLRQCGRGGCTATMHLQRCTGTCSSPRGW